MNQEPTTFKKYLDSTNQTPYEFSRRSGIRPNTIYRAVEGKRIYRPTASRIIRWAKGRLTLKDFGL